MALAAIVTCALAVGVPGRAAAQVGWGTSPETISASSSSFMAAPRLGVDAAGNAVAVWIEMGASVDGVVRAARYDRTTRSWGTPVSLSDGTTYKSELRIAVDAAGNAVATWTASALSLVSKAWAARYASATGTWTNIPLAGVITGKAIPAVNAAGDAVIVWNELTGAVFTQVPVSLQAMRYSAATATWSGVEPLAAALPAVPVAGDVGIDGAANVFVVWLERSSLPAVQATRFSAATATWSSVVDLSAPLVNAAVSPPDLAATEAGEALVSWSRLGNGIEAARWPAGGSAWGPAATVATMYADMTRTAVDAAGNGVVVWTSSTTRRQLWAARYTASTTTWAPGTALSTGVFDVLGFPSVALDGSGNAFVAWTEAPFSVTLVYSSRQAAGTGAWTTSSGLSAADQQASDADIAADLNGNALMVWQETSGAVVSTQALGWEATLPAPSLTAVTPGPGPGTLSVAFALPLASDPAFAATNLQYSLDGGGTWITRAPAATGSPIEIAGLTDTVTYNLALRAVNAAGAGEPSASRAVRSGGDPTDFRVVSRSGNLVTFAWVAPAGLAPDGYLIEGGLAGQTQVLASVPTGGAATQFTLGVPSGVFFVRVVAHRGAIRLGQSADLLLAVNAPGVDNASTRLLGSANGDQLALSWTNVANGAPLTGVRLDVGGSIVTGVVLPPTERFTFDHVPPGTYTFTVSPLVGSAAGAPSNVVTLTFPAACAGPPNPPTAFSASTQGGRVYLDWMPPAGGGAVTSYVVQVTGAYTGSLPMTDRTLAVPAPPGSYTVGVMAVGPCGTSATTAPQTVVVP